MDEPQSFPYHVRWRPGLRPLRLGFAVILTAAIILGFSHLSSSAAAANAPANSPTAPNNNGGTATNAPTAIPVGEIVAQAEAAYAAVHSVQADLASDQITRTIQGQLPLLTSEISARLEENAKLLSPSAALETLRHLNQEWQSINSRFASWKRSLAKRTTQLETQIRTLTRLAGTWEVTRNASATSGAPAEIIQRVENVRAEVLQTLHSAEAERATVLTLEDRLAEQNARVSQALTTIEHSREEMVHDLFVRDSPPIWSREFAARTSADLVAESQHSFLRQIASLGSYLQRSMAAVMIHLAFLLALTSALVWASRRARGLGPVDTGLRQSAPIFASPILTALVLSLLVSDWIYPESPRLWRAILGGTLLIPAAMLLRRLIDRQLFPILNALVVFYLFDQVRTIAASQPILLRWLFVAEMMAGSIFVTWLLLSSRLAAGAGPEKNRLRSIVQLSAKVGLVCFSGAVLANALGYVRLSKIVGSTLLSSAYLALVLYALNWIALDLVAGMLAYSSLHKLAIVHRHQLPLQKRTLRVLEWVSTFLWVLYVLDVLSLRAPVVHYLKMAVTYKLNAGGFTFSLGDLLVFAAVIWAALLGSRMTRFILEEEVYPHIKLAPGLRYSISKVLHYTIMVIGFLIAMAALGFKMTKLTIVASAVGVGLGFGLQNIINNFVSGIILLFERPVKVGDVIQLDNNEGVVQRIGIRASVIRTTSGSEIIVPNGKFISDPVTNWTFSNRQRLIDISVTVQSGPDASMVLELLKHVAAEHPQILRDPPPQAFFVNFGPDSLSFQLRAWTSQLEEWLKVKSDLSLAITSALKAKNITLK